MSKNQISKIQEKAVELKAQIAKLTQEAADMVKPMMMEFLNENSEVKGIAWTQYVPYFNDGEECVFRMNDPEFYFYSDDDNEDVSNEVGEDYGDHYFSSYEYDAESSYSKETWQNCVNFQTVLNSLESELRLLFDDHVIVKVTRDGVEVDEYSHD